MQMRLERENFRKKLVELIARKDDEATTATINDDGASGAAMDWDGEFPNQQEKEVLRYYYYIKHGIDTIHVSPMSKKVLNRLAKERRMIMSLHYWHWLLSEKSRDRMISI